MGCVVCCLSVVCASPRRGLTLLRCLLLALLSMSARLSLCGGLYLACAQFVAGAEHELRQQLTLNGEWQFRRIPGESSWKSVRLPASFEDHEGTAFDGVGVYRRELPHLAIPPGCRAVLRFHGAATRAEVRCQGVLVGEHLGGWTPFDCDVTAQLLAAEPHLPATVEVTVDELVGHNSQGFLPIIAPHFGGLWQDVELFVVPAVRLDDLQLLAVGDCSTGQLRLSVPLQLPAVPVEPERLPQTLAVRTRRLSTDTWSPAYELPVELPAAAARREPSPVAVEGRVPVQDWQYWSPQQPCLYEVELTLLAAGGRPVDRVVTRAAFREIRVEGDSLLLNGRPLQIRGVLNWGYAPPRVAPSLDPQHWQQELQLARSLGFNLMKFCLWVPPRQYLQAADEAGLLTWMEYPTWHSSWDAAHLPALQREFGEFFRLDRNHPSVVLRSLTCETGPTADLNVIRTLYDQCHAMIPGAVVEDDSSWIGWNRIHDFYDDHPYGNNHTWPATLQRLKDHITEHGRKPLVLGEAVAADTWVDPEPLLAQSEGERPFWWPGFLEANQAWLQAREQDDGVVGVRRLQQDSLHYALLMRKYQMETFRREVPQGGYVVSVIRDFPLAGMGLLDYLGQPKWSPQQWQWHGDTMLLLQTPHDRRSFESGRAVPVAVLLSHAGVNALTEASVTVHMLSDPASTADGHTAQSELLRELSLPQVDPGGVVTVAELQLQLPKVTRPERRVLQVRLQSASGPICENAWPVWVVPAAATSVPGTRLLAHASLPFSRAQELWPQVQPLPQTTSPPAADSVILTARLDPQLLSALQAGARVLLLPDGEHGSLPLSQHWFLRGGPYLGGHTLLQRVPPELLVELQHFDLGSAVVSDLQWLDQLDPALLLWDNHDIRHVRTHGLIFETAVGRGRLLVSAVNHTGPDNPAGRWLLSELVQQLRSSQMPRRGLTAETLAALDGQLRRREIDLTRLTWQFRPDPEVAGLDQGWQHAAAINSSDWKPISIGRHWEGLGYPALDGWAWYQIDVPLDADWTGRRVYLCLEGADDYYQLYVNGQLAGTGGDPETRRTAFEEAASHDITRFIVPGQPLRLVFRVQDWQGAGGLFRPVTVSTTPLTTGLQIVR